MQVQIFWPTLFEQCPEQRVSFFSTKLPVIVLPIYLVDISVKIKWFAILSSNRNVVEKPSKSAFEN